MIEGLAFRECSNDDSEEGQDEEYSDPVQRPLIAPPPYPDRDPLQKLRYGKLAQPNKQRIEDPRRQHQSRPRTSMLQLHIRIVMSDRLDIVRAIQQDDMDEGHAGEQRDEGEHHDPVFSEEHTAARLAA